MQDKKLIYIASPLKGDIERNIRRAIGYCRYVYAQGGIPLAPHVIFTQFLDDGISADHEAGRAMGLTLLAKCQELWAFGEPLSEGMKAEIAAAEAKGIKVRRFNDRCEPLEM